MLKMKQNKVKEDLLNECLAYMKFGQEINPVYVQSMIKKAFKAGYEQAIINYVEPNKPRS